jgi:hypothetical protein
MSTDRQSLAVQRFVLVRCGGGVASLADVHLGIRRSKKQRPSVIE